MTQRTGRLFADGFGLAVLRALLIPIIAVGEQTVDAARLAAAFWPLMALTAAWATGLLLTAAGGKRPARLAEIEPGIDFVLLCALDIASGGASSQIRKAFFALPLLGATTLRPRYTALWATLALAGYLAVSLAHPVPGGHGAAIPVTAMYLAWTGVAATLLAWKLAHNRRTNEQLAGHRGRLVAQAIAAQEQARKEIAYELHDEPVQALAAARVLLSDYPGHHDQRLEKVDRALATTLEKLRELIFDLRPLAIEHEGITAALEEIADHHSTRCGAEIAVEIDPGALGPHDEIVFALGRELLANAARHAKADKITLRLTNQRSTLTLSVTDDGTGIPAGREKQALRDGHIGLAAGRERVEALGGTLSIDTLPGRGTTVSATLPTQRAADQTIQTETDNEPYPKDRRRSAPSPAA